ncbi:AGE family epimerase/isomerase [Nocardioides sp. S-58]|uniref:AGE family epimerase/isomerase n=1 Tax=Nocardioides renjunii TaxID=3095075 RepID=A0ABU5KBC0_9ACTN|nr:AGE family epimerase/isomerase [Nocardioides sp. S-58]MDZ5662153.1 AGE family epimerase/isomerase [Nocardioides sp. S-58]
MEAEPGVLGGDTWLEHHREDLLPYWDTPSALGVPVGNFPSWRGRDGELLTDPPTRSQRGLPTLARGVYGYSVAFLLTGEARYLTYAKAGIDWINAHARDTVHGGWFGVLDVNGAPADRFARKEVFDLASLGLAFGMYYNVTRDPAVEADLLAVRDLLFERYYDAETSRIKDAVDFTQSTEVDTGGNGGDITNYLVPGSALLLPNIDVLSDPVRRQQFRDDLRLVTEQLVARHRGAGPESWWFWGRTARVGRFNAQQTDFGHSVKSQELILNANMVFPDRPWSGLAGDLSVLLHRAWDGPAARWNQARTGAEPTAVERDSEWWVHDEADQTLASLDLGDDFAHREWLATSARSWLDVFVDRGSPVRETYVRPARDPVVQDLRKTGFGKNMYHVSEHALVMYLHGRALEGRPARLHYAFPTGTALTAEAEPYWYDAAAETRVVRDELTELPGHRLVHVDFTGIGQVTPPPYPAPQDTAAPTTAHAVTPGPNAAGWNRSDVSVAVTATDDGVGVREIRAIVERGGGLPPMAVVDPGPELVLPPLTEEGVHRVTFWAVDLLGTAGVPEHVEVRIDRTPPTIVGMPQQPCVLWPPDHRLVQVADVTGSDARSGLAAVGLDVTADEPLRSGAVVRDGGRVAVRAARDGRGDGRTYAMVATADDLAGNTSRAVATCDVPHDRAP